MLAPEELLRKHDITLRTYTPGQYAIACPKCSQQRQPHHQKLTCLSVKIDGDIAYWHCNHCQWAGPEKGILSNGGDNGHGNGAIPLASRRQWPHYVYGPDLRKLRNPYWYDGSNKPRFLWQHRNGKGEWANGKGEHDPTRLLYRGGEVKQALAAGQIIAIVEGEKDVDRMWRIGIAATCNAHGAAEPGQKPKWLREHSEQLVGADLVIIPDNDANGYAHADVITTLSQEFAKSIRRLTLKDHWPGDMPEGGDVSDALDQRALDPDTLKDLITETPARSKSAEPVKGLPFHLPADITMAPKPWLIKHVIARGEISTWIGAPGATKSALLVDISVHVVGQPGWRGKVIKDRCAVVYFALERVGLVDRRLYAYRQRGDLAADAPLAVVGRIIDLLNGQCVQIVLDTIKAVEDRCGLAVGLVVFDTYSKAISAGGGDENLAKDQNRVSTNLRRIIEQVPVHIAGVGHTGKDETRGERGSNAKLADVDLEVTITGSELGARTATVTKANDQDLGVMTSYELERMELGTDDDGEAICTTIVDRDANIVVAPNPGRRKLSDRQKNALQCLSEVVLSRGKQPPVGIFTTNSNFVVTLDEWMAELVSRGVLPAAGANPWARFTEISNALMARGLIGIRDRYAWLAGR